MDRVLITGSAGMLGKELVKLFTVKNFEVLATDIPEMDITNPAQCRKTISEYKPEYLINAAAYTDVDGAETNETIAMKVNGEGVANLAKIADEIGACLIHFSTDYIFDGEKKSPYLESDAPNPLSVYGKSKLAGEEAVKQFTSNYLIIRTEWLFGEGRNFIETIIETARENPELRVVDDQVGSPTYAIDVVEATFNLILKGARGVVNFTSSGETSWYDFAMFILSKIGLKNVNIQPVKTSEMKRPALRPLYSILDTTKYQKITHLTPPHYKNSAGKYLRKTCI